MFRRFLFLALGILILSEPVYSQTWLQRYLRERKARDDAKKAAAQPSPTPQPDDQNTDMQTPGPSGEIRRAEPVDNNAENQTAATPAASTAKAEPAAPAETPIPIRKAEPVQSGSDATVPVLRAEPVTPEVSFDNVTVKRAEPVEPLPTPTPVAPVIKPTPRVVLAPTPEPTPEKPLPTPSPSPDANAPDVIRIAPSNKPLPPDVSQFNLANNYYAQKDYARAAVEYERYLSLFINGSDRQAALFRMAESNRQIQNFNSARKGYEALLLDPYENEFIGPAAYRLGEICFQDKNYTDALAYYRKASLRVKDPAILLSARYYIARCYEMLKANADAIDAYKGLLVISENNPFMEASHLALGKLLADSGRITEAAAQFDLLIKETNKPSLKAEVTVREGLLLLESGKNEKATALLKRALEMPELGPWREVAEVSLLRVLYNTGNYQQVLDTYQASKTEYSTEAQPELLLILANSSRQLGKDKAAIPLYEKIISEYPDCKYVKDAQYYRLISLYNASEPSLIAEVDAYLLQNPDATEKRDQLILLKAEAYYKGKKYAEAAKMYASLEDSVRLSSALRGEAIFKLGWCYTQTGDNPGAIQAFSAFLKEYPVHKLAATALAQRALCYQQSSNMKAALADYESLLARYPQATKERELALQQKALILGDKPNNDYKGMADTFKKLVAEFPDSPRVGQANYWIGWAAIESKNFKDAIHPLEEARKRDKEHFGEKATLLLLQAKYLLGDAKALAEEVDKAAANNTKVSPNILRWLGTEFFKSEDAAHADKYLGKLTGQGEKAGLEPEDWLILGSARTKLGKWADAETALKNYLGAVTEPSQQATGHLALGEAQLGAARYDDAQKSADAALSLQPEGRLNAQGRMLSGDIAMARQDYIAAAKLYLSVSLVFGDDAEITPKALAQAYIAYKKAGDTKQSAKTLNELQSRYPEYPVPSA